MSPVEDDIEDDIEDNMDYHDDEPINNTRAKLCKCSTCELSYIIIEFAESLIDENTLQRIHPDTSSNNKKYARMSIIARALTNAAVEFVFRNNGSVTWLPEWISAAWNKRALIYTDKLLGNESSGEDGISYPDKES